MLKSRFADKYVTGHDTPPPPPVRATAQSRIALDTVERDCSAADMLLAPGKTSNVGEDEKSPIRLYGLATQLPNTKLSNGLQHDAILPMLAPLSTLMSFDAHGVPLWPQTGRRAGLVYRTRCRLGHCNHSSEVRPATCAGLLEGDAGPNMSPTPCLAAGCESRDSLLRRGAGSVRPLAVSALWYGSTTRLGTDFLMSDMTQSFTAFTG
ncbi:unnamed protein product [Symbiodinium natans]|uniref:Uncharacterized protein n=1 Tax=Symbiodinium natans TaxID=878477 RepID=A0A812RG74_9DINO|nr:unnamed protein product [Symbiodinium natans]